jgi:hypothetical protein
VLRGAKGINEKPGRASFGDTIESVIASCELLTIGVMPEPPWIVSPALIDPVRVGVPPQPIRDLRTPRCPVRAA